MPTKPTTKRLTLKEERMIAFASGYSQGLIETHDEFAHANGHASNADMVLDTLNDLLAEGLEAENKEVIIMAALHVLDSAKSQLDMALQITAEGVRSTE